MRYLGFWTTGGTLALALAAGVAAAPQPPAQSQPVQSQPAGSATSQSTFDQQRFNDLIALIEGQNSPQVRRTGARELLRHVWSETVPRFAAILRGPNRAAKVAVALALSDLPDRIVPDYIRPLLTMLEDPEAEVRNAAALALASSPTDDVIPGLKSLALNSDQRLAARLAAIDALGMMTQRGAIAVLIEALADRHSPIAAPALAALERATAQDFQGDSDAALAWWDSAREATLADWQRLQIERLVRQSRANEQRLRDLEQRLTNALRENYVRTAESEQLALLNAYLTDASAAVRRLGLALAQSKLAEGKSLAPETVARTRELLLAPEPHVRAAAARTVATLRDPADAERFQQLLASERHGAVREALVNGLGYVGSASTASVLLELLQSGDDATSSEAVTALGRLSERGVLDEPTHALVTSALLSCMQATPREEQAKRERLLWAMSRVGDPRFGPAFVAALDSPEAATVRLAAVRGIAVMVDPKAVNANNQASRPASGTAQNEANRGLLSPRELIDALVPVTSDPDVGVRRAAVETLAQFASTDGHVEALWNRLSPDREPEEGIRVTAWRGALRVIASRPVSEIQKWLDRLPGSEATQGQYAIELLQAAEKNLASKPEARGELGWVRARLAGQQAAANQIGAAISTYLMALEDLRAAQSPEAARVAFELLRLALLHDRYDAQLATTLANSHPALDGETLWEGLRGEIEQRLQPDEVDRAIAMLVALQTNPPTSLPADTRQALQEMLQRARQMRVEADTALVRTALQTLCEEPDDEKARQALLGLGPRAVPAVRDALREALQSERPDPDHIQQLHDLLKELDPQWSGFAPDAPVEEKLQALEELTE
jgi:HEAT repeat protein